MKGDGKKKSVLFIFYFCSGTKFRKLNTVTILPIAGNSYIVLYLPWSFHSTLEPISCLSLTLIIIGAGKNSIIAGTQMVSHKFRKGQRLCV